MKILVLALLLMTMMSMAGYASAQSIPLPPPFPENSAEEIRIAENDRSPPKIEILTTELHKGMNVFRVRITDDSSLQTREVRYVHDGQLKTEGLFRDQDDVYRGLVDIHPPARVVVVTAGDANGNIASVSEEYDVSGSPDILGQIMDVLSQIPKYIQNLLASAHSI